MKILKEIFLECNSSSCIAKKGKSLVAKVDDELFVVKEKGNHNIKEIYDYLSSRNFDYYPKIKKAHNKYNIYEYLENVNVPIEQKAFDMIYLLSLLHNKTTFYKEMDINEYKEIYENTVEQVEYTMNYYMNLISLIESHVFMSPSEYLIARNISKIFGALEYSRRKIDEWYERIKNMAKKRVVLLYNNIDLNHVIKNKDLYLINWEKSKLGIPIYDLYEFYRKYALSFDFFELFNFYESKYRLLEEERLLLYVLISIPDVVELKESEVENCKKAKNIVELIYKSEVLISKYTEKTNTE